MKNEKGKLNKKIFILFEDKKKLKIK